MASLSGQRADSGAFPGTDYLSSRLMQLPNSQLMTVADVDTLCDVIRTLQQQAPAIRSAQGSLQP